LHADYEPFGDTQYHGNPIKGWHNWVEVKDNNEWMCQLLIFLEMAKVNDSIKTLQEGKYALVHFIN